MFVPLAQTSTPNQPPGTLWPGRMVLPHAAPFVALASTRESTAQEASAGTAVSGAALALSVESTLTSASARSARFQKAV